MIVSAEITPWTRRIRGTSAARPWTERHGFTLTLRDIEGREGRGDAAPLPGFSPETLAEAETALRAWATSAVGRSVPTAMDGLVAWSTEVSTPSARFAVDAALLALAAERLGMSPTEVIRPPRVRPLNPGRQALVASLDDAAAARREGFGTFKVKMARSPLDLELSFIASLREHYPGHRIRVDANGGWQFSEATRAIEGLVQAGIDLLEQPLPVTEMERHQQLRGRGIAIALDESVRTRSDLEAALAAGACDAVVLKPTMVGGIFSTLSLARRAVSKGLGVMLSHAFEDTAGQIALATLEDVLLGPGYLGAGIDVERCLIPREQSDGATALEGVAA